MKRNYIYAIMTVIIWATAAPVTKVLMEGLPTLETLAVSGLSAFLFMLLLNLLNGKWRDLRQFTGPDYLKMAGLGFLGLFLYTGLYYYGIFLLGASEACILNYLWPIMILVFSCLILKESFTRRKALAMICSFLGVIILVAGGSSLSGGTRLTGILVCLCAAVCYGLFSVLNKLADFDQNITMTIIWLVVAVCSFATGPVLENWVPVRGIQWLGLIWLGVVTDAIAYLSWAIALNRSEDTARIANLAYLTPFLSVILSAIYLGEKIRITAVAALVLIVGGILIQNKEGSR